VVNNKDNRLGTIRVTVARWKFDAFETSIFALEGSVFYTHYLDVKDDVDTELEFDTLNVCKIKFKPYLIKICVITLTNWTHLRMS